MAKYFIVLAALGLLIACDEDKILPHNHECGEARDMCDGTSLLRCNGVNWFQVEDCGDAGCEEHNGVAVCITSDEIQVPGDEDAVNDDDAVVAGYTMVDVLFTDLLEHTPGSLPFDEKRYEVFRDETAFGLFFTSLGLSVEEPVVDFDKDMVISLYNGMWTSLRPIYQFDGIKKLVPDDPEDIHHKVLFVETTTHYYSDKLGTNQVLYYPLLLIKVEKADFVNFNDRFVIETSY